MEAEAILLNHWIFHESIVLILSTHYLKLNLQYGSNTLGHIEVYILAQVEYKQNIDILIRDNEVYGAIINVRKNVEVCLCTYVYVWLIASFRHYIAFIKLLLAKWFSVYCKHN